MIHTPAMDNLHWQLSVLSKAIHYKNLSAAANHVGLSQPQLSRIISKLEQDLGVTLLDRTARRKSGWTPVAFKIAETYFSSSRKLTLALQQLTVDDQMAQISIGTLEGLVPLANEFCRQFFAAAPIHLIELNIYDLNELEEKFEKDEIDLIFTCRAPGKLKNQFIRSLGYQEMQKLVGKKGPNVFSQFEYANHVHARNAKRSSARTTQSTTQHLQASQIIISNSLAIRRHWIEEQDGRGFIPSPVKRKKGSITDLPVHLIASDLIHPTLWEKFEQFQL